VKGALTTKFPPHGDEMVSVPVVGAFTKDREPETLYKLLEQAVGTAVNVVIEQLQDAGAVKFCVNVHAAFALKDAVTEQAAPFAVKPAKE
jgi:hypothetical protein